jgi:hypothetical protein
MATTEVNRILNTTTERSQDEVISLKKCLKFLIKIASKI